MTTTTISHKQSHGHSAESHHSGVTKGAEKHSSSSHTAHEEALTAALSEHEIRTSSPVAPHHRESFKGYTLQQLRYRKAVTELKIEVTKDKVRMFTTSKVKADVDAVKSYFFSFENIMRYVDYALLGYNTLQRISAILRRFGFGKKNNS